MHHAYDDRSSAGVGAARFCLPFGASPKVVMDAYLAAFAVAGGYRLVTLDRAFVQFKGLEQDVLLPLE